MTMQENCEQLTSLVRFKFEKDVKFFALPKTNDSQKLLEDEMAVFLLQNKNLRSFFKGNDFIVPIFRGEILDGAAIVKDGNDLSKQQQLQITELVELLLTDIMSLESESELLNQSVRQLENQARRNMNLSLESKGTDIIH